MITSTPHEVYDVIGMATTSILGDVLDITHTFYGEADTVRRYLVEMSINRVDIGAADNVDSQMAMILFCRWLNTLNDMEVSLDNTPGSCQLSDKQPDTSMLVLIGYEVTEAKMAMLRSKYQHIIVFDRHHGTLQCSRKPMVYFDPELSVSMLMYHFLGRTSFTTIAQSLVAAIDYYVTWSFGYTSDLGYFTLLGTKDEVVLYEHLVHALWLGLKADDYVKLRELMEPEALHSSWFIDTVYELFLKYRETTNTLIGIGNQHSGPVVLNIDDHEYGGVLVLHSELVDQVAHNVLSDPNVGFVVSICMQTNGKIKLTFRSAINREDVGVIAKSLGGFGTHSEAEVEITPAKLAEILAQ